MVEQIRELESEIAEALDAHAIAPQAGPAPVAVESKPKFRL
jgi:hypothetical protein